MKRFIRLLFIVLFVVFATSCGTKGKKAADTKQITVFSAASLTDVLGEIIDSFEVKYPIKVQTNLASSGTLARQIEQGEKPDVYISASKKWADYVESLGVVVAPYKTSIAKNELVLIAPKDSEQEPIAIDSATNFIDLLKDNRLSIGDPAHVPAGKYAKQSLEYYEWFAKLDGKLLPAKDVRSALMVVEMGEAPVGIVYLTDAMKSEKVKVIGTFNEASHKPIVYFSSIVTENDESKDFYNFLTSEEMKPVWSKYGFK
jgi:molybdate transport system substrate-binding protein